MQRSIIVTAGLVIGLGGGATLPAPVIAQSAAAPNTMQAGTLTPNAPNGPATPAPAVATGTTQAPAPGTTGPGDTAPGATATTDQAASARNATAQGPARGANSFTRGQARSRIARAGYRDVAGLKLDSAGVWRGSALHHGKKVHVWLDYTGRIGGS